MHPKALKDSSPHEMSKTSEVCLQARPTKLSHCTVSLTALSLPPSGRAASSPVRDILRSMSSHKASGVPGDTRLRWVASTSLCFTPQPVTAKLHLLFLPQ